MTIAISVTCTSCGNEFDVSHRDIITSKWRTCPKCRQATEPDTSGNTGRHQESGDDRSRTSRKKAAT